MFLYSLASKIYHGNKHHLEKSYSNHTSVHVMIKEFSKEHFMDRYYNQTFFTFPHSPRGLLHTPHKTSFQLLTTPTFFRYNPHSYFIKHFLSTLSIAVLHQRNPHSFVQNITVIEDRPLQLDCSNIISNPPPTHLWSLVDLSSNEVVKSSNWKRVVMDERGLWCLRRLTVFG